MLLISRVESYPPPNTHPFSLSPVREQLVIGGNKLHLNVMIRVILIHASKVDGLYVNTAQIRLKGPDVEHVQPPPPALHPQHIQGAPSGIAHGCSRN